jgi:hypothetical protein
MSEKAVQLPDFGQMTASLETLREHVGRCKTSDPILQFAQALSSARLKTTTPTHIWTKCSGCDTYQAITKWMYYIFNLSGVDVHIDV